MITRAWHLQRQVMEHTGVVRSDLILQNSYGARSKLSKGVCLPRSSFTSTTTKPIRQVCGPHPAPVSSLEQCSEQALTKLRLQRRGIDVGSLSAAGLPLTLQHLAIVIVVTRSKVRAYR